MNYFKSLKQAGKTTERQEPPSWGLAVVIYLKMMMLQDSHQLWLLINLGLLFIRMMPRIPGTIIMWFYPTLKLSGMPEHQSCIYPALWLFHTDHHFQVPWSLPWEVEKPCSFHCPLTKSSSGGSGCSLYPLLQVYRDGWELHTSSSKVTPGWPVFLSLRVGVRLSSSVVLWL